MNISTIRAALARLRELADERACAGAQPLTLIVLPDNGRGPEADSGKPLPRVAWRDSSSVCIVYDPDVGQPDAEAITRLLTEAQP